MKLRPPFARWILAAALCLEVLAGGLSGARARGQAARPFATLASFWGADAAQLRPRLTDACTANSVPTNRRFGFFGSSRTT